MPRLPGHPALDEQLLSFNRTGNQQSDVIGHINEFAAAVNARILGRGQEPLNPPAATPTMAALPSPAAAKISPRPSLPLPNHPRWKTNCNLPPGRLQVPGAAPCSWNRRHQRAIDWHVSRGHRWKRNSPILIAGTASHLYRLSADRGGRWGKLADISTAEGVLYWR